MNYSQESLNIYFNDISTNKIIHVDTGFKPLCPQVYLKILSMLARCDIHENFNGLGQLPELF